MELNQAEKIRKEQIIFYCFLYIFNLYFTVLNTTSKLTKRQNMNYKVIIFDSTSYVIKTEKTILAKSDLKIRIIPIPKNLSANCGICIRFNAEDEEQIQKMMKNENIIFKKIASL